MLQAIEKYIHQFSGYLKAIIQKDNSAEWDLTALIDAIAGEFKKYDIQLAPPEALIFLMVYIPHIYPNFYDEVMKEAMPQGGDFPEFGGVRGSSHRGLLPTGETAQFILAGDDIEKRLFVQQLLTVGTLVRYGILYLETVKEGEPIMSGRIIAEQEWTSRLVMGIEIPPRFGPEFPAKRIITEMQWDDLVLNPYTLSQINDIKTWLTYNSKLMEDEVLKRKVKPGYRVLLHGPPGTGKTLTASLLGKQFNKDVYRIDLSQIVSKYIGETEKNLEKIFSKAENKGWILFFDEADALFGKRTQTKSSNDRYANQEVSYLFQRIEDFPGLLILASNFKSNMDEAFLRRFHTVVHFPAPNPAERLLLWQKSWPANYKIDPAIGLKLIADKYELNGAAIINIMHYACLKAIARDDEYIRYDDVYEAIKTEYRKEERSMK